MGMKMGMNYGVFKVLMGLIPVSVLFPFPSHAMRLHRVSLKRPRKSVDEYLATLDQRGLKETVSRLRP